MSEPSAEEIRAALADTLWVVWGFPEPTQTFIHREMEHMEEIGGEVHTLAGFRIERDDLSGYLAAIEARTRYLGAPALWVAKGLAWAARHPIRFARAERWILGLPHRTQRQRARMSAMLLAAASVADDVQARYRYLHAHFGSYHTELTMCLSKLTGLPYGVTFHAVGLWKDDNIIADKVQGAEVVLSCTGHNVKHLKERAGTAADRVHLVYHGLHLDKLPAPLPYPAAADDGPRWLSIGRLVPKKGFDVLIKALAGGAPGRLTIVGDGPERSALEALATAQGVADRVTFAGSVPNARVFELLGQAHALVAPSLRDKTGNIDGIPNVTLEAFAVARPVVGTRLSGIPEVVVTGETGALADPNDVPTLIEALQFVAADHARAEAMGERGRDLIHERFDVTKNMKRQLALIVAAGSGQRPT